MTITATMRRCSACFLEGTEAECPRCNRKLVPPMEQWPAGARKFLYLLILTDTVAVRLGATEQSRHEYLLENAIRGRYYEGKLIPYAANASECYPQFLTLFERWQAQGSPTDFVTLAQLRGTR